MNVLLVIWDHDEIRYAVIPKQCLNGYSWTRWDGVILGLTKDVKPRIEDEIVDVFDRLGLEDELRRQKQNFRRFLHVQPPYNNIVAVIRIGWVDS